MSQCQVHLLFNANVVHYQTFLFAFKGAVHARDGLDQVVAGDGFVDIDGVEKRYIKTGEPHVYDNGNAEVAFGFFELSVQLFAVIGAAEHVVQIFLVVLAAGHDELYPFHRFDFCGFLFAQRIQ